MEVYIVLRGEDNEGGGIVGVFSNMAMAQKCAFDQECHFGGGWRPVSPLHCCQVTWENGCDHVDIETWEIEEDPNTEQSDTEHEFEITIVGLGKTREKAWEDAKTNFLEEPGDLPEK